MITRLSYGGWKNNIKLSNEQIELVATLDVGPRIIRFAAAGGQNVLKEYPEQLGGAGEADWQIRGGHRLWHAPEAIPRSYFPDNDPVACEEIGDWGIRLTPQPETTYGVQKQMEITMAETQNMVTVTHRITNIGAWDIELAAWALTVMDAGGLEILPLPGKQPHGEVLAPGFPLVVWPYTDLADPRLRLGTRYITLRQDASRGPIKIGLGLELGWAAYQLRGDLFVKYFDYDPNAIYPDFGCSFETFTRQDMLEVESLSPLALLAPGDMIEHTETWQLFTDVPAVSTEEEIDTHIRPLIAV
ncbi:MAG TPA: hypothetical protein VGM23_01975 [Armatimonadota bacterium]|jgi:hypothetical protein